MRNRLSCALALVAALCVSTSAFAALTPGQKMAAEALIKQFTAPEFDTRQKAVDRLVEMGVDVVPVVKETLAKTLDNEVKLRCEMVLKALKVDEPAERFGYGPSKVTLDVKDLPLSEVVEKLAEQSGNKAVNIPPELRDRPVTLSVKDADYWVAVQALCEKMNLIVTGDWARMNASSEDAGWFRFIEAEKDAKLAGYSGPVVVRPETCTKALTYRQAKTGAWTGWAQGGATFTLSYAYEDRLEPIASTMEVKAALGPDGKNFAPAEGSGRSAWAMPAWPNLNRTIPWGTAQLALPELPPELRKLAEISGVVRLEFGSGQKEVRIDDVLNAVGKEMKIDDWTVKVTKVEKANGFAQVQIEATCKEQPTAIPAWMTGGSYGWWLKEAEGGRKVHGLGYGTRVIGTRGGGMGIAKTNPAPAPGAQTLMFQGNFEGVWSLVLVLPVTHETKEYPFAIKDIPLP